MGDLAGNGLFRFLGVRGHDVKVGGCRVTVAFHDKLLFVVSQLQTAEVVPCVSQLLHNALLVDGVQVLCSMPHADEVYRGVFRVAPHKVVDIGVERLCQVRLLTCQ